MRRRLILMRHLPVFRPRHCLAIVLPLLFATAAPCHADGDSGDANRAESLKSSTIRLCGADHPLQAAPACKDGSLDRLVKAVDAAAKKVLDRTDPRASVLFKRDQVWFRQMVQSYAENMDDAGKDQEGSEKIIITMRRRAALLDGVAQGAGRRDLSGRWVNVFASVTITPAADGAYRIALSSDALYGPDRDVQDRGPDLHPACKASALVRPAADGWLVGKADAPANWKPERGKIPARVRVRLQGETLRVVAGEEISGGVDSRTLHCRDINQLTGSYFASGKSAAPGAGAASMAASITAPTFDCTQPATAAEEEICADPELAVNDIRLNRAWTQLLPRLDAVTRRLLTDDQRAWLKAEAERFASQLHSPLFKLNYFVHLTAIARDSLADMQRDRIAMLEGFDENRRGFEGDWEGYNATVTVYRNKNGSLSVEGSKIFENDYKATCEYFYKGKVDSNLFTPDEKSDNPDTIERDHASLIVNRGDDEWVKRQERSDRPLEGKCTHALNSSTARVFPVRPRDADAHR